jgi:hypothetical protein
MEPHVVLARTPQGAEALARQDHTLPRTLRHALILVDGHATVAKLEHRGAMIPDFPAALRELVARGLVAAVGHAAPFIPNGGAQAGGALRPALVRLAEGILGDKSAKIVRKLEDAGASPAELSVAVDSCFKLIRLTIDEKAADEFRTAAREVIARGG